MAALLVCFNISTGHKSALLLNWMVANVWECAALECVILFVLFMFCTNHRQLRILDWNTECVIFHAHRDFLRSRDMENIPITGQFKFGLTLSVTWQMILLQELEKKLGDQMWMCFLERLFHVVSEDAVQFCVILMNDCQFCCACVFFVCLYLHSEFWKNHLHIWCFLSACTLHTNDPGWWNADHKVCIVAVLYTDVHTHTCIHTLQACKHTLADYMHVDTP